MCVRILTAAVCSLLVLFGCTTRTAPVTAARENVAPSASPSATPIHGTATYVERIKMPAGASLRVELVDAASGEPVATSLRRDVAGPPIAFSVNPPSGRGAQAGYALHAVLLGPRGERWFETPAPVLAIDGVELRMRRVADGVAPPAAQAGRDTAHWECGELGVMSRYADAAGRVALSFNGRTLTLPVARAASGARYADAHGNEFWTKGATGRLTLAGDTARDCVEAAQASPWNQAAARGVVFRAVGNEPGWAAEVAGTPPSLDATLDYGEHRLRLPLIPVTGGFNGSDDGHPLRLRIERTSCRDDMSGQAFEARVTLDAGGRVYRGCGAWLQD